MRLIIIFYSLIVLTINALGEDLIQEGMLYCNSTHNTVDTTIIYLNGITNSLGEAEESRNRLEKLLKENSVCYGETCAVEKFYNKTDGLFDDKDELSVVSNDIEEYAIRQANIDLLIMIREDYVLFHKSNLNNIQQGKVYYINDAIKEIKNGFEAVPYINAQKEINLDNIKKLIKNIFSSEPNYLTSKSFSYYTYLISFKNSYKKALKSLYYANREFYKNDNNARQALTRTIEGLISYLEERYLQGQKIVIVAHSQGNHMIELAHAILSQRYEHFSEAVKVVGVASVAHTTPNDCYVTNTDDTAIDFWQDAGVGGAKPLTPNFEIDDLHWGTMHNFIDVYTNKKYKGTYFGSDCIGKTENTNLQEILIKLIKNQKDSAIAHNNQIQEHSILTASLRWEKNYDDMDLYTKEPGGTIVYYNNKQGSYGSLDRDDTDYEGPEHYSLYGISTANVCSAIPEEGATWEFGIHQYPDGGSKAITHFQIKVGDDSIAHKSYSLDSWPSQEKWIGKIVFGSHSDDAQYIDYTITIRDQEVLEE